VGGTAESVGAGVSDGILVAVGGTAVSVGVGVSDGILVAVDGMGVFAEETDVGVV